MQNETSAVPVKSKHAGWQTSRKERACYYTGFAGIVGQSAIVANYLSTFILLSGIDLRVSAFIILIIKGIDAVDDVLFGFIVDKIKWDGNGPLAKLLGKGSYLPWIRLVFLFLPLTAILLYGMPMHLSDTMKIVWFSVGYLLWDLVYTIIDVPMNAMVTTMTNNTDERNVLIAYRSYPQLLLVLLITSVSTVLISEKVGMPIGRAVLVMSFFTFLTIIPIALGVREHNPRHSTLESAEQKYTFRDMVTYLKGNKYLALLYGGYIIHGCLGTGAAVGLFTSFYLFHNSLFSLVHTLAGLIPGLAIMVLVPILARKHDKFKMMITMASISILTGALIFFVGHENIPLHLAAFALHIVPSGFAGFLIGFICPNCVEYGKYKTGIDGTGITFAIQTFAIKMTGAIASSLGILFLGMFGWVSVQASNFEELATSGVAQSALALRGLWIVNWGIPIIGMLLCVLLWTRYKLRDKDVDIMIRYNEGELTREEADAMMSRQY